MFPKKILRAVGMVMLLLVAQISFSQNRVITGKVTDTKDSSAVGGATVSAKGTRIATQTGSDGSFSISVPSGTTILVISSVGFATQEVSVEGKSSVEVWLIVTNVTMNEVVVTGYGSVRRKDLTSAITTITSKDFTKGPITTPDGLINGRVAGVQITTPSGAPGAGARILIRGGASLSASNAPLIVVDNVPLDNNGISGAANPLSLINPNDIESFNILKDASATAIYGNRASNGVIIITTKKGKTGKPKVSFSTLNSLYTVAKTMDVLSADEFKNMVMTKGNSAQQALLGTSNTDWQDEVYQNAFGTDNNISLSGGIQKLPYRVSLGYLNQQGILITGKLSRFSGFINLSPTLLKNHLKIDLNIRGAHTNTRFANEGAIGAAAAFDPTQSVHNSNGRFGGYFEWIQNNQPYGLAPRNPVALLELRNDESKVNRLIGNIQLDYKLHWLPDLRFNVNIGFDRSHGEGTINVPDSAGQAYLLTSPTGQKTSGLSNQYEQDKKNKLLDAFVNYIKDIKSIRSNIDLMFGYGYQDFLTQAPTFPGRGANGVEYSPANPFPFETQNTLISYYGRFRYGLMGKYLLTVNVRRDGSSRFNPDLRWKTFPGVSVAWVLSEEKGIKKYNAISNLKLRFGYGETGQQDVGFDYPYITRYTVGTNTAQYQFGNSYYSVYRPVEYDYNLKWEETSSYNAGIDFGFFKGRLTGSIDFYKKKTKDLLSIVPIPAGTNFSNELLTNVGNMENKGIEFSVNATVLKKKNSSWDIGVNLTYNENKITKLTLVNDPSFQGLPVGGISGGVGNTVQIQSVGYPRNAFFVLQQVYTSANQPIEGLYVDRNGDGIINNNDYYRYKKPDPDYFIGFNTQVTCHNWTFSTLIRSNIGNYMYNNPFSGAAFTTNSLGYLYNVSANHLNTGFKNNQYFSDYFIENATFLKMDNLSATYDFGKIMNDRATLRGSIIVQNVFTLTKYKGLDPEIAGGIDNNFYTRPRVFSLGFNLEF
ncbi:MAG: SusC/RagA family TonB-linked outer membrane protein [Sphingobacteriales bacterium]|nr:SusC/RagA family TonB-linked outer membrane protein [Sphingobacteriales bacterium]